MILLFIILLSLLSGIFIFRKVKAYKPIDKALVVCAFIALIHVLNMLLIFSFDSLGKRASDTEIALALGWLYLFLVAMFVGVVLLLCKFIMTFFKPK